MGSGEPLKSNSRAWPLMHGDFLLKHLANVLESCLWASHGWGRVGQVPALSRHVLGMGIWSSARASVANSNWGGVEADDHLAISSELPANTRQVNESRRRRVFCTVSWGDWRVAPCIVINGLIKLSFALRPGDKLNHGLRSGESPGNGQFCKSNYLIEWLLTMRDEIELLNSTWSH